jgi:hypothetical protein
MSLVKVASVVVLLKTAPSDAIAKRRPLHLQKRRCSRSIAAGLFQGPPNEPRLMNSKALA